MDKRKRGQGRGRGTPLDLSDVAASLPRGPTQSVASSQPQGAWSQPQQSWRPGPTPQSNPSARSGGQSRSVLRQSDGPTPQSAPPQQSAWGAPQARPPPAEKPVRAEVTNWRSQARAPSAKQEPASQGPPVRAAERSQPSSRAAEQPQRPSRDGAARGKRMVQDLLHTKPIDLPTKQGSLKGSNPIELTTNYFRMTERPIWDVYQYRVDFSPEPEIIGMKKRLLYEHKNLLKSNMFDGSILFKIEKLPDEITELVSLDRNGSPVKITIKYTKLLMPTEGACLQLQNIILKRAMDYLGLVEINRQHYDVKAKIDIRSFNLTLFPGYNTSIRQHEDHILLNVELTTKIVNNSLVYDLIRQLCGGNNFKQDFMRAVGGQIVSLTYSAKQHRVDDVDYSKSPRSTFETRNGPKSYIEYYKEKYDIQIKDPGQPLLVTKSKAREIRAGQSEYIYLIPELCQLCGLDDRQKANYTLMKDVANYTRIGPAARVDRLLKYNQRLNTCAESVGVLRDWDLKLDSKLVTVPGRELNPESVDFGDNRSIKANDWTNSLQGKMHLYRTKPLHSWIVICPSQHLGVADGFIQNMITSARSMGFQIAKPIIFPIPDDRAGTYTRHYEEALNRDPQLVCFICPNNRADRYSAIKKISCIDRPLPTQVLLVNTITPRNRRNLLSIASKVVIQMNAKLGYAPWNVNIPINGGYMIIGFDVCHDTNDKSKSYGAMVATLCPTIQSGKTIKYYSCVTPHTNGTELSDSFALDITKALKCYVDENDILPSKIIIYRDGVGDGQIHQCLEHEVKTIENKLKQIYDSKSVPLSFGFIIVSKRINTRLFKHNENPIPGTVVDSVITLPERFDFFLVSQTVRQGTVSPTSYNVVRSTSLQLPAGHIQLLTYKLCHMYFNCSSTIRVPAVCQYAHKLAFLAGQYTHRPHSNQLEDKLYFL